MNKVSIYCPHCHQHTALSPAPVKVERGYDEFHVAAVWHKDSTVTWWMGVCNYCNEPVLVLGEGFIVYHAAHPNANSVEKEDAEDIIDLAQQLLQIVYVAPAIAQNRRTARGR